MCGVHGYLLYFENEILPKMHFLGSYTPLSAAGFSFDIQQDINQLLFSIGGMSNS